MPRLKKTDRPVEKTISLPTSTVARVDLELYSELEGKVPYGAWQSFINGLIIKHFDGNKVFIATGFKGHYPVGTAAIIVAASGEDALRQLNAALNKEGLPPAESMCLREVSLDAPFCNILLNGDY